MCGMGSEVPARLGVWWEQSQGPSAFSFCVPGLTHVTLIELRPALILYQDYPMLLLTMARHCHMLQLIELRLALISYQDYHMLLRTLAGLTTVEGRYDGAGTLSGFSVSPAERRADVVFVGCVKTVVDKERA